MLDFSDYHDRGLMPSNWESSLKSVSSLKISAISYSQRWFTAKRDRRKSEITRTIVVTLYLPELTYPPSIVCYYVAPGTMCSFSNGLFFFPLSELNWCQFVIMNGAKHPEGFPFWLSSPPFLSVFTPPHQSLLSSSNPPFGLHQCRGRSQPKYRGALDKGLWQTGSTVKE